MQWRTSVDILEVYAEIFRSDRDGCYRVGGFDRYSWRVRGMTVDSDRGGEVFYKQIH